MPTMLKSLEDYIVEMENRSAIEMNQQQQQQNGGNSVENHGNSNDLWTQLQQKENDLLLAAELGKALLEKNEELKKQNEAIIEEYSKKLETVEQDRHLLKRKLINQESEYESRLLEYQNDIKELTNKLTIKENLLKQFERDKTIIINELNAQNIRLTNQLKESTNLEIQLQQQIDQLKDECKIGKNHLNEHINSVDSLRDELILLNEKNKELERRLQNTAIERDNINHTLEEATDRILLLERHTREQDLRLQHSLKDYSLPQEKLSIEEKMNAGEHRSLLAEMDISEPTLSQECMSIYRQLRSLIQQLKSHNDDDDSGLHSDCSNLSFDDNNNNNNNNNSSSTQQQFSAGLLSECAQELVNLVLDTDVVRLIERLEQTRRDIHERDMELSRRSDKIMELSSKVSVCEVELQAALEERDRARNDASNSSLAQDELVLKAREDRDLAVQRKTKAEIELAKTRVELMQANSQLLEAIQQKVELSQQLEQWQMDMQELLDEQLKNKLTSQEVLMRQNVQQLEQPPVAPPRRRLLSFFLR